MKIKQLITPENSISISNSASTTNNNTPINSNNSNNSVSNNEPVVFINSTNSGESLGISKASKDTTHKRNSKTNINSLINHSVNDRTNHSTTSRRINNTTTSAPSSSSSNLQNIDTTINSNNSNNSNEEYEERKIQPPRFESVGEDSSTSEYFGPASNFSFVKQLNHFLRQLDQNNAKACDGKCTETQNKNSDKQSNDISNNNNSNNNSNDNKNNNSLKNQNNKGKQLEIDNEIPNFRNLKSTVTDRRTNSNNNSNHMNNSGKNNNTDERRGLEKFGIKLMILKESGSNYDDQYLLNISTELMNELITSYLETWHIPCPLFIAEDVFTLSIQTWKNPSAPKNNRALLYLILSIGASASYFDLEGVSSTLPLARGFFDLALKTVPTIFSELSLEAVRILLLMSVSACNLGDTALSYLYSGNASRVSIAIGLHKQKNGLHMNSGDSKLTSELLIRNRVWVAVWHWESYWSFCVGRPSLNRSDIPIPIMLKSAYNFQGYGEGSRFRIRYEHMRLRVIFGNSCGRIYTEIYSSNDDLLTVLDKVEKLSGEIDNQYFSTSEPVLCASNVEPEAFKDLDLNTVREWFWIRIYYLYLKLLIFRPFLIFYAYLNNSPTKAPPQLTKRLKQGSDYCVQVAIDISNFIIKLNRQVKLVQPIFFICTYLESACTVLLFYIVSNLSSIPDELAATIWDVLNDTSRFLSGSSGPYVGTIQIIANDAIKSLQHILRTKTPNSKKSALMSTYFDKVIKPVVTPDVSEQNPISSFFFNDDPFNTNVNSNNYKGNAIYNNNNNNNNNSNNNDNNDNISGRFETRTKFNDFQECAENGFDNSDLQNLSYRRMETSGSNFDPDNISYNEKDNVNIMNSNTYNSNNQSNISNNRIGNNHNDNGIASSTTISNDQNTMGPSASSRPSNALSDELANADLDDFQNSIEKLDILDIQAFWKQTLNWIT